MNRSSLNTVNAGGIRKFFSLALSAAITSLVLLASCGDTVYEAKGGGGVAGKDITGTINVHVRDGAGKQAFFTADDGVSVTLIAQGTRPQQLGANGAVSFPNLQPGSYEIRVQKEGYATSYYTARVLIDETDINAGFNVNIAAVLYKLDAELTGTLEYLKSDGTSGPANGATVTLEVDLNRSREDKDVYDVKIEERVFAAVVADGKYTFTGLPTVPGSSYQVISSGFSAAGVDFEVDTIFAFKAGPSLLSGTKVTARTVTVPPEKIATKLRVISVTPSVKESEPVEVIFNAKPANLGVAEALVRVLDGATPVPVNISYGEGNNKIIITPKSPWNTGNRQEFNVVLDSKIKSENGASLDADADGYPVFVSDANRSDFELINIEKEGTDFVLYVTDTSETLVLKFSKTIDQTKLGASFYKNIIPGEAYVATVDGNTITLSPLTGKWSALSLAGGNFNLALNGFVAVDGSTLTSTVVRVTLPSTQTKFVVTGVLPSMLKKATVAGDGDTLILSADDDTSLVTFSFSKALAISADAVAARRVKRTLGAAELTWGDSSVTLDIRKSEKWGLGRSAAENRIELVDFISADGVELNDIGITKYYVLRKDPASLSYIGVGASTSNPLKLSHASDDILLNFDSQIADDLDFNAVVTVVPYQPFTTMLGAGGKTLVLSPAGAGLLWNVSSMVITLDGSDLKGKDGSVLGAPVDVYVAIAGGGGLENPLAGTAVGDFFPDTILSHKSNVLQSKKGTMELIWSPISGIAGFLPGVAGSGYEIFAYRNGNILDLGATPGDYSFIFDATNWKVSWDSVEIKTGSGTQAYVSPYTHLRGTVDLPASMATDVSGLLTFGVRGFQDMGTSRVYSDIKLLENVKPRELIAEGAVTVSLDGVATTGISAWNADTKILEFGSATGDLGSLKSFLGGTSPGSYTVTITVQGSADSKFVLASRNLTFGVPASWKDGNGNELASVVGGATIDGAGLITITAIILKTSPADVFGSGTTSRISLTLTGENSSGGALVSQFEDKISYGKSLVEGLKIYLNVQ